MAFSTHKNKGPQADINVTPLVDVMLVLLIIFMVAAPLSVLAALHFPPTFNLDTNPSVTVQYNRTAYCLYGSQHCTTPWRDVQLPVQSAVERAILTEAAGGTDVTLTPGYARFPNPDVSATNARDFGEYVDAIYVLLACIFPLVVQMNQLVQEK